MANTPVSIGTNAIDNGTATSTPTITTGTSLATGDAILVAWNVYVGASGPTVSSMATSNGDTFTIISAALNANNSYTLIGYNLGSTHGGLGAGGTITLTLSGTPALGYYCASAFKVVGGLLSSDQNATALQGATGSLSVGPTGTTADLVELVFAAFAAYNTGTAPSFTAGGSYSALTASSANGGSDYNAIWPEYLLTAATGQQTATGTAGVAPASSSSVVAAFRYVPPPPVFTRPPLQKQALRRASLY